MKDPTPIVGEEMVANTSIENATHDAVIIRNNERVIVKEVEKTNQSGLDGAFIQYTNLDGEDIEEPVFVPASPAKYANRLKELAMMAKGYLKNGHVDESKLTWRAFYALKERVADIRFTYAMTINKCQGMTLHHALIDMTDIAICQNREQAARLAYTGVTRATTYVTIEGELGETYNDTH
ncbi:MAG: helicase C-terminal domain-containing protein [Oleispira sp.]